MIWQTLIEKDRVSECGRCRTLGAGMAIAEGALMDITCLIT